MENYDEDLTENRWYITLCEKHEDLYTRATNERWMICIPRNGSWKESIEDGDLFSHQSYESHILKPVLVYSCDGNSSNTESENKFVTYNGKEVFIQGSKILCGKGFSYNFNKPSYDKRSQKLALNVEACHTSRILFEETFFNENDESYIVLCLSEPLEPHLVLHKGDATSNEESSQQTKPRWEMYGSYLWKRANNSTKLRQQIDERISQFVVHRKTYDDSMQENELQLEVNAISESVVNLLTACLHIILRDSKLKKHAETPSHKQSMKEAIEGYVLHGIHRTLITELNNLMALQDCALNMITRNLPNITLSDLGVQEQFWSSVPRARRELSLINRYRSPKEKLSCLQNAILFLSSKPRETYQFAVDSPVSPVDDKAVGENSLAMQNRLQSENMAASTDDLLPMLIYLIIKCEIPNWLSNLAYLKYFNYTRTSLDKSGFCLATIEAALEHVRHENLQVTKVGSFKKQNSTEELEHFFMLLRDGEIDGVKRALRTAEALRSLQEHDKCHPLCECSKCSMLSQRKSTGSKNTRVSVSCRDDKGRTPLHIVAITGKHELVDVLVNLGADVNTSDYHGATPLHLAAQEGNQSVIFLLLHYGTNANADDNNNNTALHLACLGGHEGCVKALLYYDPMSTVVKVNAANDVGDTPLHIASKWGYSGIAKSLMEYGADPHRTNKRKVTPFNVSHNARVSRALRNTDVESSAMVMRTKQSHVWHQPVSVKSPNKVSRSSFLSKPKQVTEEERTFKQVEKLLRAVGDNDLNMVSYVCGWDIKPILDKNKCHPLCQCFKCQPLHQDDCLHANSADTEGTTPLIIASKLGYIEMVELLISHGARVNVKTRQHCHSPLHLASQYGHDKIVEILLEKKALYDIRDTEGNTPIYMCSMNGHTKCVSLLLKKGASVNIRNHRGDSPLHEAVRWKHCDTACILIENGALNYYKNNKGFTALALSEKDQELHASLVQAFTAQDESEDGNPVSIPTENASTNEILPQPARHKSLSQSEADELIAEDLYDKFQAESTPDTPPMIETELDNFNDKFNFEQTCSSTVSDMEEDIHVLSSDNNDHISKSDVISSTEEYTNAQSEQKCEELPSNEQTGIPSSSLDCDTESSTTTETKDELLSEGTTQPPTESKTVLAVMVDAASSQAISTDELYSKESEDNDTVTPVISCKSENEGSYFEIASKLAADKEEPDASRNPSSSNCDITSEITEEEVRQPIVVVANEDLLRQPDNEYLSLNNKLLQKKL